VSPLPADDHRLRWKLPTLFLANVRSLTNKLDDFEAVVQLNHPDIICLTETWLSDDVPSEAVGIDGFDLFRKDRNRQGGGVACYVRSGLSCTRLPSYDVPGLETLWLMFRSVCMPRWLSHLVLAVVYHPPNANSRRMSEHIVNCIDEITRIHPNAGVAVVGDFNRMKDEPLRNFPLRQLVRSNTRKDAVLDKIYTNMSEWYNPPVIVPQIGTSDHRAVLLHPTGRGVRCEVQEKVSVVRSRDSNGRTLLAHALMNFNWTPLYRLSSCEEMVKFFYSAVLSLLNQHLPLRQRSQNLNDKPWVTEEFRRVVRRRQYAWTHRRMVEYRRYRNQALRLAKTLRKRFYNAKVKHLRQSDSRNWWRQMKRFTGQSKASELSGLANSIADGDVSALADMINVSLKRVSDDLQPLSEDNEMRSIVIPDEYIILPQTVLAKLERIKIYKAPGPDELPNWLLRDYAPWLCEPVCAIFNASVREGIVPPVWKKANVLPLPKVHPPTSIDSDIRPISLTPTLSKILESFVGRWILDLVDSQLDDHQFGGLKRRSTSHALVDMLHHWNKALDDGHSVRILFVDYAKAFDHVDHNTVIQKLKAFGVPDFIIRWMSSFLRSRQQRVKLSEIFSDWITLSGGMPQGSYLGPLIFILLINDLRSWLHMHKFIDDTTLSEIIPKGSDSDMQRALDAVLEWSHMNYMNINCKKTKEMVLGSFSKAPSVPLSIASMSVERVPVYKLLGVTVNSALKWDDHVAAIKSKAAKRLWFLKKLKRAGVSVDDLIYYYQAVIRPLLEYASVVWHSSLSKEQTQTLENVQRRALQIILGNTSCDSVCRTLEIALLSDRRREHCESLFRQIARDESHVLHYLLPTKRDSHITDRLRSAKTYPTLHVRTSRFQNSFIPYALTNLQ